MNPPSGPQPIAASRAREPEGHAVSTAPAGAARPLEGRCVALPETRELDRLASLLERAGARTLRCPLVAILDAPDPAPAAAWLTELVGGRFTDVVFLTGEGVRRLMDRALDLGIDEDVVWALERVRKIVRGPKPARVLHELGLSVDLATPVPTSAALAEELGRQDLRGRVFGVQLYGDDPARVLVEALERAGARVRVVAPYVYASASDDARVLGFIGDVCAGAVDAIAFTSAPQVERLWAVATRGGVAEALREGLSRILVAAVGPVVKASLQERGVPVGVVPAPQFYMRRLTQAIIERLGPATPERTTESG